MGCKLKCRVIDVGCRLTDDLKKFSHKAEAISNSVKQNVCIGGCLNLTFVSDKQLSN